MPQEWSKGKTPVQQIKSDIASVGRAIKITLGGGTYLPGPGAAAKTAKSKQAAADYAKFDRQTRDRNTRGAVAPRGPTVAEQVAARKAAKLAARKKKGQAQRKKYEAAGTMAKKMKLLFT
jgi:hypothetical protein